MCSRAQLGRLLLAAGYALQAFAGHAGLHALVGESGLHGPCCGSSHTLAASGASDWSRVARCAHTHACGTRHAGHVHAAACGDRSQPAQAPGPGEPHQPHEHDDNCLICFAQSSPLLTTPVLVLPAGMLALGRMLPVALTVTLGTAEPVPPARGPPGTLLPLC
jgi:hypothetical protein